MAECWADDNNFYNAKGYLYEEHDQENDFHSSVFCLLTASLTGCGSETVTEIAQTDALSQQEIPNRVMEAPEMTPDQVEVPAEDVQELIQAGLNAVMEESDLWSIFEFTDTEVLMQLMMLSGGGRERHEGEIFEGEPPEKRTPTDGEFAEIPVGGLSEMPQGNGETPPENRNGVFSEDGQSRGQGGGRQPGNRGGGMAGVALVVTSTEDAVLSKEDILSQIQLAAEELGLKASSMELTEGQEITIEVHDGHTIKLVYLTNAHNNSMNFYVVGCTRVGLTALKNDISSVLCCPDGISLNHVEADMMIDSIIRNDGILIYDASCECLQ